jgi:hypothetical protein
VSTPRVTLYSRPGCHLCDDARAVIEAVCADLEDRYRDEIPVTLVDGRQHDFWRVDAARLRSALSG